MNGEEFRRLFRWFAVCVVLAFIMGTAGLVGAFVLAIAAIR